MKSVLSNLTGVLIFGITVLAIIVAGSVFIYGSAWVCSRILPLFKTLAQIDFCLVVFVFLPLAIFRSTRGFSVITLYISSYIFGSTLWIEGLLLTLLIWGVGAVVIGLFIMGIGVVPIAMLATLIHGMWRQFLELSLLAILTFSTRIGAMSLCQTLENEDDRL